MYADTPSITSHRTAAQPTQPEHRMPAPDGGVPSFRFLAPTGTVPIFILAQLTEESPEIWRSEILIAKPLEPHCRMLAKSG
ncbi:uncharacterized protein ColSpa_10286 [Colletotrichum spaethianum]|uniref:Uncharacterized protein n=1 Tax=Colletotrichum spaethianum TaxID=700344 RepID=A0AA37PD63_9PEZI|nr:uncharacterized protein ColSpa_10286 [Colletotrichum spaethianum]GKT50105.1 hypothetical protein ColSpa_10286 [Colletotrichum spaethianum]